jgi:hypothetical protein
MEYNDKSGRPFTERDGGISGNAEGPLPAVFRRSRGLYRRHVFGNTGRPLQADQTEAREHAEISDKK